MQALMRLWHRSNFKVYSSKIDRVTCGTDKEGFPDEFDAAVRGYAEKRQITIKAAYEEVDNDTIDPSDPLNPGVFLGARIGPNPSLIQCELCAFQGYNQSLYAYLNAVGDFSDHTGSSDPMGIASDSRKELLFMKELTPEERRKSTRFY